MTDQKKNLVAIARETVDALAAWRDDVDLRIHLAGMDAKDAWRATTPHLELAEARLRGAIESSIPASGEKIGREVRAVLTDVRDQLRKLRPVLEAVGDDLSAAGHEVLSRLERDVGSSTPA